MPSAEDEEDKALSSQALTLGSPSEKKDVCLRGGIHGTGLPIETTKVICKAATATFVVILCTGGSALCFYYCPANQLDLDGDWRPNID